MSNLTLIARSINTRTTYHVYPSPLVNENRMNKIAYSQLRSGLSDRSILLGLSLGCNDPTPLTLDQRIIPYRIRTSLCTLLNLPKPFHLIEWQIRVSVFFLLLKTNPVCVSIHSLSSFLIPILLTFRPHTKVVYDTHELETERTGWSITTVRLMKIIERLIISRFDCIVCVSDAISNYYKSTFPSFAGPIFTVRNIPLQFSSHRLSTSNTKPSSTDAYNIVSIGVLGNGRGILETVRDFRHSKHKVEFIGFFESPQFERRFKQEISNCSNISFSPAVKPWEVTNRIKDFDLALHTVMPFSRSYCDTISNKYFEYVLAGLPILCYEIGEVSRLITENDIGWVVSTSPFSLLEQVDSIALCDYKQKLKALTLYRSSISWDEDMQQVISHLIGSSS